MIRVAVIDRHPAIRAGIEAILGDVAGVSVVAATSASDRNAIHHALYRTTPDVVLLEDAPGRADGVELARELKSFGGPCPKVLLLADRPDPVEVATAILADADGIVDSGAEPRELVEALQTVAAGGLAFPDLRPRERSALARLLPPEDHAILAMRLAATPRREISDTLRIDGRAMRRRLTAIVARLQAGAVEAVSAPPRSPQAT